MMDYYRCSYDKTVLFSIGQDKLIFLMDPHWWIMNDTQLVKDSRPSHIALQETMERYYGRNVACELVLESGQESLEYYLELSTHKEAASTLQGKVTIDRPGHFRSLHEWLAYVGTGLKFHELKVRFKSVKMLLYHVDGSTAASKEHVIYNRNCEWSLEQIETAYKDESAETAVFICVLEPGVPPDERHHFPLLKDEHNCHRYVIRGIILD